jgi:protein O-GlcNAc transferase
MSVREPGKPPQLSAQEADRFKRAGECFARGEHDRAAALLEALLNSSPGFARGWFLLGYTEAVRGRFAAAVERLERAVQLAEDEPEFRYYLGKAYASAGRRPEAVQALRDALARAPGLASAQLDLGLNLQALGDVDAAIPHLEAATRLEPHSASAFNALGMALRELHRYSDAEQALRMACRVAPDDATSLRNLAAVLKSQRRWDEAIEALEQSLAGAADDAQGLASLGILLARAGRGPQAIDVLRRAHAMDADDVGVLGWLIRQQELACDWSDLAALTQAACEQLHAARRTIHPFVWLSRSGSAQEQRLAADLWAAKRRIVRARPGITPAAPRADDRIRVAYLSADFYDHAMAYLMAGVFEHHDRSRFEVTALSLSPGRAGEMRARLLRSFEHFVDLSATSDQDAARQIGRLGIDIAVDLMGYTHNARSAILAQRPAAIQANYLGYPGTMGGDDIDYIIADRFVIPRAEQAHYSEKIVYLPDCFQANDSTRAIGERTPMRGEAGLPADAFVYCCFNSNYKLNPTIFDLWMGLLQRRPRSVLWLLGESDAAVANLRREAQSRGVDPTRLVFAGRTRPQDYLARYRLADLFLDTLPFNGGATASDALWAGLPIVTCAGEAFASRMAGSLLRAVGMPELVTHSLPDYEALALKLAADEALLRETKAKLARNRLREPLFDTERFTRNLEAAYAAMWDIWRKGEPPRHIDVRAAIPRP